MSKITITVSNAHTGNIWEPEPCLYRPFCAGCTKKWAEVVQSGGTLWSEEQLGWLKKTRTFNVSIRTLQRRRLRAGRVSSESSHICFLSSTNVKPKGEPQCKSLTLKCTVRYPTPRISSSSLWLQLSTKKSRQTPTRVDNKVFPFLLCGSYIAYFRLTHKFL